MAKKRRTKKEVLRDKGIQRRKYREHAKALRDSHLFGKEMFNAKDAGIDLRMSPDKWSAEGKRRITNYWKELAPRLSGDYKVKRYYKPGRLEKAAEASLQGKLLPGQKAVAFSHDKDQDLEVEFDRYDRIHVKKGGINQDTLLFDMDEMLTDPMAEVDRILASSDANVFKIITGKNESKTGYTRQALVTQIERWIEQYHPDDPEVDPTKTYDKWLFGLIEYPNLKVTTRIVKRVAKHEKEVKQRGKKRLKDRAEFQEHLTPAEKKSIKLTGRKGRTK